jgi:uncharacterized membrane protein YraQ (UPF0718 family)
LHTKLVKYEEGFHTLDILQREFVYLRFFFTIQFEQIFWYWLLGMAIGSVISVFGKERINQIFAGLSNKRLGLFGIIPACILGIASPLCMYGTIPIAASFSEKGIRDDWLAAFMMSSILLNPQLIIYSAALGNTALYVRIASCFICGIVAGLLIHTFYRGKSFFNFTGFVESKSRDTDPSIFIRLLKNFGRNITATGLFFLVGVLLSAMFQHYVPANVFARVFGSNRAFGTLMAATIGVPMYVCGGGTIPLLQQWMMSGMSMGAAAAFMIAGPAMKITNIGAVKIVLGVKRFVLYILFGMAFAFMTGFFIDLVL